ncbi:MAG: polysaccharide biosynthesis/export family protein [Rhodobacteraceae bacterium]|nr:polysaccharide biosynthesis/export family protein [Paracoccaceae bacterium]
MRIGSSRAAAAVAALAAASLVAGCGLPRSGPTKQEFLASAIDRRGGAHFVEVTDAVAAATALPSGLSFSREFLDAGVVASDTIYPGDVLSITIWENVDQGVLAVGGNNATQLPETQVDGQGFIFVPYAGRIRAAGNSPEALRQTITRLLENQTPDPQVVVARKAGDGATVSVIGNAGVQGVFPLERPNRTLTSMLAQAGGISVKPEVAKITVTRGRHRGTIWLSDLYADPANDIALRAGDKILVEEDDRAFIALGATGGQRRVPFERQELSAIDAIAEFGGLNPGTADPTGIFVLREEPAEIANRVLGRTDLRGPQRMAYVIDLTKPSGIFIARDFMIRDEDTIYVTEAPFLQWQKIIGAITGAAGSANNLANLADGNDS